MQSIQQLLLLVVGTSATISQIKQTTGRQLRLGARIKSVVNKYIFRPNFLRNIFYKLRYFVLGICYYMNILPYSLLYSTFDENSGGSLSDSSATKYYNKSETLATGLFNSFSVFFCFL